MLSEETYYAKFSAPVPPPNPSPKTTHAQGSTLQRVGGVGLSVAVAAGAVY